MAEIPKVASLILDIGSRLRQSQRYVDDLGRMVETMQSVRDLDYNEAYDETESALRYEQKHIYTAICALLEILTLPALLAAFKDEYAPLEARVTDIEYDQEGFRFINKANILCWRYLGALPSNTNDSIVAVEQISKLGVLEAVLRNTPLIIVDRGIDPTKEFDIKKAVYETLRYYFSDTEKEVPVPQITKNYSIDIAIPSLKAAVELKFADSLAEAKKSIDDLYTDMYGYKGSGWENCFALVYSTEPRFSQEQLDAQLKKVEADQRWKLIAVHGPGSRPEKK